MKHVIAYTDGSCHKNPGPGGWAFVLLYTDSAGVEHKLERAQGYTRTTNNRMELRAATQALRALHEPCHVELHIDSQYVMQGFTKGWVKTWQANGWKTAAKKPVKNVDLWQELWRETLRHDISWVWVKGHVGIEYNEHCDELANAAASDSESHVEDVGFEG